MSEYPESGAQTTSTATSNAVATGAVMQAEYMGRTVKTYPVHEMEIDTLSSINAQATVYFSLSTALVSYAIGIWTNAIFYEKLTASGLIATRLFAPMLLILSVIFIIIAIGNLLRRDKILKGIKGDSLPLKQKR